MRKGYFSATAAATTVSVLIKATLAINYAIKSESFLPNGFGACCLLSILHTKKCTKNLAYLYNILFINTSRVDIQFYYRYLAMKKRSKKHSLTHN